MSKWEFNNEYRYWTQHAYKYHSWRAIGRHLALDFHCSGRVEDDPNTIIDWHGGVEIHHRLPPTYMAHRPPTHECCTVFGEAACWHDGSSTWASEHWIPMWEVAPNDHDGLFVSLNFEAARRTDTHLQELKESEEAHRETCDRADDDD